MEHIQRSDFSIPYFVEIEEIENSHVFVLSCGTNGPVKKYRVHQQLKVQRWMPSTTVSFPENFSYRSSIWLIIALT